MFHPLIKLLASKPHLLANHVGAYAGLAALQAAEAVVSLRRQALLSVAAASCLCLGVVLGGVALMLLAVVPVAQMPTPWLLAAVPGVPLLGSAVLWWLRWQQPGLASLAPLRAQWDADMALLAEAGAE